MRPWRIWRSFSGGRGFPKYPGLDFEFVKRKLAELLGADDSRIANFEHIAAASKRIAGTEGGRVDQC